MQSGSGGIAMIKFSNVIIALTAIILSACGTVPHHQAFPVAAKDKITSTDVLVPIAQSEIYVFVPSSNVAAAGGGGLLLALIDAGVNDVRTTKANEASKSLRDALIDFSFDNELQSRLKASLSTLPWLHAGDVRVIKDTTTSNLRSQVSASKAASVLLINGDYNISNDGDALTVTLQVVLFPNADGLKTFAKPGFSSAAMGIDDAIYRNTFVYNAKAPGANQDRDHDLAIWSANKGEFTRTTLVRAMDKLSALLVEDIQDFKGSDPQAEKQAAQNAIPFEVIRTEKDGTLGRVTDGTLKFEASDSKTP